jgi:hypothetical protein
VPPLDGRPIEALWLVHGEHGASSRLAFGSCAGWARGFVLFRRDGLGGDESAHEDRRAHEAAREAVRVPIGMTSSL